jgi:nucleoside-triphosphatase THEP1
MVNLATLPKRLIVTGASGTGKTSFCQHVIEAANVIGWQVAGLLSLPRFEAGQKTGIFALDLSSGEKRLLASCQPDEIASLPFGKWMFDTHTLTWGDDLLKHAPPCDLLIIDEIGPLEFDLQHGWTACFQLLLRQTEGIVLVTIRPSYLARLQAFWQDSVTMHVDTGQAFEEHLWKNYKNEE